MLARDVQLFTDAGPCELVSGFSPAGTDRPGWQRYRARWRCDTSTLPILRSDLFFEALPSHLHFARLQSGLGTSVDRVLTDGNREWRFWAADAGQRLDVNTGATSFFEYVGFGIKHIGTGYDHLAFVLALLLLAVSLREVAGLVTAFTLAHSVTLATAVFGWVRPFETGVEAIIGFSIALVAIENGWLLGGRPRGIPLAIVAGLGAMGCLGAVGIGNLPLAGLVGLALFASCHFALLDQGRGPVLVRAFVAFAFGLVHGFGFAGVLAETPGGTALTALAGFNVGVEAGQLAMIAIAWPLLQMARRIGAGPFVSQAGSAAVAGLGLFWFLVRAYG
jgi:hypothetical protein